MGGGEVDGDEHDQHAGGGQVEGVGGRPGQHCQQDADHQHGTDERQRAGTPKGAHLDLGRAHLDSDRPRTGVP